MLNFAMKNIPLFALVGAVMLLSWGCRKDVEEIRPYPVTLTELSLFLKQVPDPGTTTTFQFNTLSEDKILTTPGDVRVFLTDVDQLFQDANTALPVACSACSDLKIVVTIAKSKGDILARGLPTSSVEDKLLETGGMVQVQAFCSGAALRLLTGRSIKVQLPDSDPKDGMYVHVATHSPQGFNGWKNTGQEVFKADWPASAGSGTVQGYELIVEELGWSNCARVLSAAATTSFCTNLQSSFTGLNTQAYLLFDNFQVVAPLKFDDASHSFCFPNVPAGYPVRVVTVAKLDAEYWLGASTTETGTNSMLPLTPQPEAAPQLLGYLRGL